MNRTQFTLRSLAALGLALGLGCSSSSPGAGASAGTAGAAGNSGTQGAAGSAGARAGGGGAMSSGGSAGADVGAGGAGADVGAGGAGASGTGAGRAGAGGAGSGAVGGGAGAAGATSSAGGVGGGSAGGPSYPAPATDHRAIGVHDPSMIHVGAAYYLFATGGKLSVRSSTNLSSWSNAGAIFSALPGWIATELGMTITDLWAPDVSFQNGTYRVYYAGSVFGSNHSVIGLATNTTLDPKSADYAWVDQGLVIESNKTGSSDDWNAIDPNFVLDESGNSWLVFGSFWSGIKLRRLDASTGKVSSTDSTLYALASNSNGIEAASIVFHGGYYYLFVSFDACCKGVNSTYRTMVGRSAAITGPYTDNTGKAMLKGGALQLLASDGRYIGPGGGTAFRDGDLYYYVYHYYDGQANGASYLMMRPIGWSADGWPALMAPLWQ